MCEFGLCRANLGNSGSTSANFGQLRTIPSRSRPRLADLGRFGARSADAHAQMIHNPNLWPRARIESWPKLGEFATELAKIPRIRPNSGHTFPNPPDIGRIRARIGRTRPARSFSPGCASLHKGAELSLQRLAFFVGRAADRGVRLKRYPSLSHDSPRPSTLLRYAWCRPDG